MNYEFLNANFVERQTASNHCENGLENLLYNIAIDYSIPEKYRLAAWREYDKIEERKKARQQAKIRKTESIINEIISIIENVPSGYNFSANGLYDFLCESEDFHNYNQNPTTERKYYATREMTKKAIKRAVEKSILEEKKGYAPYSSRIKVFYVVK